MNAIERNAQPSADFDAKLQQALRTLRDAAAAHPGRIVWRLDLAQPPEQRGDAWVLRQTAALLAQAPVRAAFDLPASADGDAEDVCDALDGLNGRGLAAGQALAPHAAPRHGC